ncbi:MAG: LLM class flavin-dependent oxidoreductase [Candidatus Eremiobacteraeota bacterium]|nr:LLM class flavin-dependent oxidoreductase [Candidatus Eremiobacteraeota bacterium]
MIPFSVLDLCPIVEGGDAAQAFSNSVDLARHAEGWGYHRFWLAEHHNMQGIASAATSVVIGHVAAATRTIRVGAGGVMLPNHSPLVIAEQFGTLATLFPGRIDLGLGRAPGTDPRTTMALRRDMGSADTFPEDVNELETYFSDHPGRVQAVPGKGLKVPLILLGSSLFSAQLAAAKGLPFAFASHFAPQLLDQALHIYRQRFQPSTTLQKPHAIVGVPLFAADSDEQGQLLLTSMQRQFINLRRGVPGKLQPPEKNLKLEASPAELAMADQALSCALVGSPDSVEASLKALLQRTQADELIFSAHIYDHQARLRAYQIAAEVRQRLGATCP